MTPTRRAFVLVLLGGALTTLRRSVPRPFAWDAGGTADFNALGRAYLSAGGSRSRAAAFLVQTTSIARRSGRTLGDILQKRRAADFQSGSTVLLDRWVVAESEALFCAGLVLSEGADA